MHLEYCHLAGAFLFRCCLLRIYMFFIAVCILCVCVCLVVYRERIADTDDNWCMRTQATPIAIIQTPQRDDVTSLEYIGMQLQRMRMHLRCALEGTQWQSLTCNSHF